MTDRTRDDAALRALLSVPRRIAVVGASPRPDRASHRIFVFLQGRGHDVLPVNPVADEVAGVKAVPDLQAAAAHWGAPPEVEDVFRSPEFLQETVEEALDVQAEWLWTQLGVVDQHALDVAHDGGLEVVADRCILVEAQRLGL